MTLRKGLGLNKGKGYRNLLSNDPRVHSQSRQGIRQPQRLPQLGAKITARCVICGRQMRSSLLGDKEQGYFATRGVYCYKCGRKDINPKRLGAKEALLTTNIYKGTYGRKILHPELVIESLMLAKITDVHATKDRIKLKFNGQPINCAIKENPTVKNIANWGHSFIDNKVYLDKDAPSRYKPQLALHEAIEQHVSEKHGLKYREAHQIAEHFERKYAESQGIDWEASQNAIFATKL
jgi:hypothetical protein